MRNSGRLLTAIALIVLLAGPALPAVAGPVSGTSWQDLLQQVEVWITRVLASLGSEPARDAGEDPTPDVPTPSAPSGPRADSLQTVHGHDDIYPGLDPDG